MSIKSYLKSTLRWFLYSCKGWIGHQSFPSLSGWSIALTVEPKQVFNNFTAPSDGWVCVRGRPFTGVDICGNMRSSVYTSNCSTRHALFLPVRAYEKYYIYIYDDTLPSDFSARFYPSSSVYSEAP